MEISCHASGYIASELLEALCRAGCRMAQPGEFTRRAYLAGKMDLSQAEAVADLIAASSRASHELALSQMRGAYSQGIRELRAQLLELSALLELELDFSEEEVEFADRAKLLSLSSSARERCAALADSFRTGNAIKNGIPVAIVGDVNAGKSTLLNALVGDDRAIVSDVPGTTRDTVDETCTVDGVLFRFIDTAGIREATDEVERMGIERTFREIGRAQIVVGVIDGALPAFEQRDAAARIRSHVGDAQKLILVRNKSDIAAAGEVGDAEGPEWLQISAFAQSGLEALRGELVRLSGMKSAGGTAGGEVIVTSERHASALRRASECLGAVCDGLTGGLPGDLLAEDLRAAISSLSEIIGEEISSDEVLGEVFGRFCIGK